MPVVRPYNHARYVRSAIQASTDSNVALAQRLGVNPKTVAKWKKRTSEYEFKRGPRRGATRSLAASDEYAACVLRAYARLSLGQCLALLRIAFPHLTKSSLHRCFRRNGIGRLREPMSLARGRPPRFNPKYDRAFFGDLLTINLDSLWADFLFAMDLESGKIYCYPVWGDTPDEVEKSADSLFPTLPGRRKWLFINEEGALAQFSKWHSGTVDVVTYIRDRHACAVTRIPSFLHNQTLRISETIASLLFDDDSRSHVQGLVDRMGQIVCIYNGARQGRFTLGDLREGRDRGEGQPSQQSPSSPPGPAIPPAI